MNTNNIITITKVKTPWFLFSFLLKKAFIKSIPEYASKQGLLFKYYHITDSGKTFGGIYLWKDQASANALFNKDWYAQVKKKLNTDGKVDYYDLLESKTIEMNADFKNLKNTKSVLIKLKSQTELVNNNYSGKGILQIYIISKHDNFYAIILFKTAENFKNYIEAHNLNAIQFFDTPVLLKIALNS